MHYIPIESVETDERTGLIMDGYAELLKSDQTEEDRAEARGDFEDRNN